MQSFSIDTKDKFLLRLRGRELDMSSRTIIMGVLNVTPDSFSDGGRYAETGQAVERGLQMVEEGADIIDVGGESSRPRSLAYGEGATAVSMEEECRRVLPVIEEISRFTSVPISIDTTKSAVAREALHAGAAIVNDISGLRGDLAMAETIATGGASALIMHMQGTPQTMQENPRYNDLFGEIHSFLSRSLEIGLASGIGQFMIDPGIGFGKSLQHNLHIIAGLSRFKALGWPIAIGISRKNFIGAITGLPHDQRLEGSLAASVAAVLNGANVLRVHDVLETKRAILVADEIKNSLSPNGL